MPPPRTAGGILPGREGRVLPAAEDVLRLDARRLAGPPGLHLPSNRRISLLKGFPMGQWDGIAGGGDPTGGGFWLGFRFRPAATALGSRVLVIRVHLLAINGHLSPLAGGYLLPFICSKLCEGTPFFI